MTHDDMIQKIAKLSITPETNVVPSELATALMAVVEYIRPNEWDFIDEKYNKIEIFKIIERHLK
jgi:hypothetical protein